MERKAVSRRRNGLALVIPPGSENRLIGVNCFSRPTTIIFPGPIGGS
jgi:hypothetical protein